MKHARANDIMPGPIHSSDAATLPLDSGEHVLWQGRPPGGLMFRAQDTFLIPFTVLWCAFAIFWEATALTSAKKAPAIFALWGIPFVAVGLYMVFGRFIVDAIIRARTVYAVTDRRVVIVSGISGRNIKSLFLAGLTEIDVQERSNGRGAVVFGPCAGYANPFGASWPGARGATPPTFESIENPRRVYDIIRQAQQTFASSQQQ